MSGFLGSSGSVGLGTSFGGSTSGGNPFPSLASLKLRLESDLGVTSAGGLVTAWSDQEGNILDFIASGATRPTLVAGQVNGLSAIRFNGTTNFLDCNSRVSGLLAAASAFKVVAIIKNNSVTAHAGQSYNEPGIFVDSASFFSPVCADATNIDAGFFQGPDHEATIVHATGSLIYVETTLTTAGGGTLSLQVGTGGSPDTHTGVGAMGGTSGFLRIGLNNDGTKYWLGDLFALYVCDAMTGTEVTNLRKYLNNKYGPGL